MRVFESLADNAQAFMAGMARSIELQQADAAAVLAYKQRLIDYLERFIGDLVGRSGAIAQHIALLHPRIEPLLWAAAQRKHATRRPVTDAGAGATLAQRQHAWRRRWGGLRGWFVSVHHEPPQAEVLRSKARAAIPQLLVAVAALNERRSGRSDRSADFRVLAGWFVTCGSDEGAHRLGRAAFAPSIRPVISRSTRAPAIDTATTPWAEAPPLQIHPRLREYGEAAPRGRCPRCANATRSAHCSHASCVRSICRSRPRVRVSLQVERRACRTRPPRSARLHTVPVAAWRGADSAIIAR